MKIKHTPREKAVVMVCWKLVESLPLFRTDKASCHVLPESKQRGLCGENFLWRADTVHKLDSLWKESTTQKGRHDHEPWLSSYLLLVPPLAKGKGNCLFNLKALHFYAQTWDKSEKSKLWERTLSLTNPFPLFL